MVPDCTLTTACFDLSKYTKSTDIRSQIESLLAVPCYLVIYTDAECIGIIKEIRNSYNLQHITKYFVTRIENLPFYRYIDTVNRNRKHYWPTKDERTSSESHLLCCSKFNFVLETMQQNPFHTTKFGWIDAFVGPNFSKICEDYTPNMLLDILDKSRNDKFHIQMLASVDKKYKKPENKREYYSVYKYFVCGCLFITNKEIGRKIMNRLNELFITTTEQGYGHGEEMLYLEVVDEFYDDIQKSYGDYGQILNNFFHPMRYYRYIHKFLIHQNLYDYGNAREAYDCCKALLYSIEQLHVDCFIDVYMATLLAYYKSSLVVNKDESIEIVKHIYDVCKDNADMRAEYEKYKDYYIEQFNLCGFTMELLD